MIRQILVIILVLFSLVGKSPNLAKQQVAENYSLYLCYDREKDLEERIQAIKSSEFSEELLKEYIGWNYPNSSEVVIKQFILETGWFRSDSFTKYNNICGMRLARVRKTTATGTALNHASYDHWTDSVDDYFLWVDYYTNRGYKTDNYYQFLDSVGYATASNYIKILKQIKVS